MSFLKYLFIVGMILSSISYGKLYGQEETAFKLNLVEGLDQLELESGDLAFFQSIKFSSVLTQIGTFSPFTHVGMIMKRADGSLFLIHATDNDYQGYRIPVVGEKLARNGIILTKLEDLFNSIDGGEKGFYRRIWIRKRISDQSHKPNNKAMMEIYDKYKNFPFEASDLRFALSAIDLSLFHFDPLSLPDNPAIMCSEFVSLLFEELDTGIDLEEKHREITPADVYRRTDSYYHPPIVFKFIDGKYRIE